MSKITLAKVRHFVLRKKFIPILIGLIVVGGISAKAFGGKENISIITPTFGELSDTISATGEVTSKTDLNLSFNKQGTVRSVKVEVGDKVQAGQILATLDLSDASAQVTQARGSVLVAEAKLKKIMEGSSNEEVALAKVALENAKTSLSNTKKEQATLVKNSYRKMLSSSLEAVSETGGSSASAPTITGTWQLENEGTLRISIYATQSGSKFSVSGSVNSEGDVSSSASPLGNTGLYISFPSTSTIGTTWVVEIPNKKSSDYLANKNAYEAALKSEASAVSSAQSLVDQREAELAIKQAGARTSDVDLAEAEVVSAKGGLERARANYEDNIIRAPGKGTITKVDVKYGELAEINKTAIVLEDIENLYVEAQINESDIANLAVGQKAGVTFDAFGADKKFTGTVSHIDPSSVSTDGVVNYKIKVALDERDPNIRPGMNAEVKVQVLSKQSVISIPLAAVTKKDGVAYVNVITNEKKNKYRETPITLGTIGDGNMVEVTSGLREDSKIAITVPK